MDFDSTMTRMTPNDFYQVREYNPLCGQRIYRPTNNAICVKSKLENDDNSSSDELCSKICKPGRIQILNCPAQPNPPVWTLPKFRIHNEYCAQKKRGDMLVSCNLRKNSKVCVGSKIRATGTSCWKKLQQLFDTPCSSIRNVDRNTAVLSCPKNRNNSKKSLHCVKSTTTLCSSTTEDIQQEPCEVPAGYTRAKVLWQLVTNTGNLLPVAVAENPSCPETWVKLDTALPAAHCPGDEISQECQNKADKQLFTCIDGDFPLPIYVPSEDKETSNLDIRKKCRVLWPKSQDIIKLENKTETCTVDSEMKKEQCQLQFNPSENSKEHSERKCAQSSSTTESLFSDWWNKPVTLPDQFSCNTPKLKPAATCADQNTCRDENSVENQMAHRESAGPSVTENVPPPEVPLETSEQAQQGLLGRLIDIPGAPTSMSLFLPLNRDEMKGGARLLYSAPQEASSNFPSQKCRATQTSLHNGGKIFGIWHSSTFHGKYPFLRLAALPENTRNVIDSEYSTWTKCEAVDVCSGKANKPHRVIGTTRLYEDDNFHFNQCAPLRSANTKNKVISEVQDRSICNTELAATNNVKNDKKSVNTACKRDSNEPSKTQDKSTKMECVTADSQNVGNSSFAGTKQDQRKILDGRDRKDQGTCNKCASRRGKPIRNPSDTDLSVTRDFSPQEIMKYWTPSPPKKAIIEPNPDYVDLSLKDFSLKKYLPIITESEKKYESKETTRPEPSRSVYQPPVPEKKKELIRTAFWIELKPKENMQPEISTLDINVKDRTQKKNQFMSALGKNRQQNKAQRQSIEEPAYRLPEISILKDRTLGSSVDQVSTVEKLSLQNDIVIDNIHVGMPVAGSKQKILIPISIPTTSQQNATARGTTLTDASETSNEMADGSRSRVNLKIHLRNDMDKLKDQKR